jgi:pimeloyl-ACP methyl ester carboxylesterase
MSRAEPVRAGLAYEGPRPVRADPPAVRDLHTCGGTGYWWEDTARGAVLLAGAAGAGAPAPVALPAVPDGLAALAHYPGLDHSAVLAGHPGGDYGWLSVPGSVGRALVRRPTVVWLDAAGPALLYPRFPAGSTLDDPPVDGLELALHRPGSPFADDAVLLRGIPPGSLVSLEATADPAAAVVRTVRGGAVTFDLLRLNGDGAAVERLPLAATARTRIALGRDRWWRGEDLGTARAALYATPPGTLDPDRAVRVELPAGTALLYVWATRERAVLRTLRGRTEQLVAVDGATLTPRVLDPGAPAGSVPEAAASPAGSSAVWLRVSAPGAAPGARLEILTDGQDEPRPLRTFRWPAGAPPVTGAYRAPDGVRLPVEISGTGGPVVLLEHPGMTALANAPLERALDRLAVEGEITLARAATRLPAPAHRVPDGERGYNDLLAAAEWLHEQRQVTGLIVIGHSMGAVGAARAVLLRPELFRAAVLRFPVTDLVDFPSLGIGRHWISMLGDPARPEHRAALATLSPLHLPLPAPPLPDLLIQVGRYDTRADPRHGRRLADRLRVLGTVELVEYRVGHVESVADTESRRAVRDVTSFLRRHSRTPRERSLE